MEIIQSQMPEGFSETGHKWYAAYTLPQHERAVEMRLVAYGIETFLPTWESTRVWKNRLRMKITHPLFPSYLFVRIRIKERSRVLRSPGVVRIVGNSNEPVPIPDSEIDFLRSDFCLKRVVPYSDLAEGDKVRIKSGSMQGVEGLLVRKNDGLRFVVTLNLINQHAAIEVSADELEPVLS